MKALLKAPTSNKFHQHVTLYPQPLGTRTWQQRSREIRVWRYDVLPFTQQIHVEPHNPLIVLRIGEFAEFVHDNMINSLRSSGFS